MKRASLPLIAAISMAAVALSGCTVAGGSFTAEQPAWKSGYSWAYDYGYEETWAETYDGHSDNGTWSDEGHIVRKVVSTNFTDHDGEPYYLVLEDGDYSGIAAYRQRDLQYAWVNWDIHSDCSSGTCINSGNIDIDPWGTESGTHLDFPLSKGKRWSHVEEEGDDYMTVQILTIGEVIGQAAVNTELGSLATLRVDFTTTIANLAELLEFIEDDYEMEPGVEITKLDGNFEVHTSVYYSHDYMTAVRMETVESSTFILEGNYEGEEFASEERYQGTNWETLTGASLVAGPELTESQIFDLLRSGVDLEDPSGEIIDAAGYWVEIDPVRSRVAAPDGQGLEFEAFVGGDGLPEGHTLSWNVRDWTGDIVHTAAGTAFTYKGSPGTYDIDLVASDGEQVFASAQVQGFVDYLADLEVTCGTVEYNGLGVPDACTAHEIPVHPGARLVSVEADMSSSADPLRNGEIVLTDAFGTEIEAGTYGDNDDLKLEEVDAYGVTDALWDLEYVQSYGVNTVGTMEVYIEYGPVSSFGAVAQTEVSCCSAREGAMDHFMAALRA